MWWGDVLYEASHITSDVKISSARSGILAGQEICTPLSGKEESCEYNSVMSPKERHLAARLSLKNFHNYAFKLEGIKLSWILPSKHLLKIDVGNILNFCYGNLHNLFEWNNVYCVIFSYRSYQTQTNPFTNICGGNFPFWHSTEIHRNIGFPWNIHFKLLA